MESFICNTTVLATTFAAGGLTSFGNIFDVHNNLGYSTINLTGMDVHIAASSVNSTNNSRNNFFRYEVYTQPNSILDTDFLNNFSGWKLHQRGSIVSRGYGQPTPIENWIPLIIPADSIYSFYVTLLRNGLMVNTRTDQNVGTPFVSDGNIDIMVGFAIEGYPLNNTRFFRRLRAWNGRLKYHVVDNDKHNCPPHQQTETPTVSPPPSSIPERVILKTFYRYTNRRSNWTNNFGWLDDDSIDICRWYGVRCNADGRVIALELTNNDLIGTTPPVLYELSLLERIVLDKNPYLSFTFEGIRTAFSLRNITISETSTTANNLNGIGDAPNLAELILVNSSFSGMLPNEIYNVDTLEVLMLDGNAVTGTISTQIARLRNLKTVSVSMNYLSGSIPLHLSALRRLEVLNLSSNRLSGPIPSVFASLTLLYQLELGKNRLSGPIPSEMYLLTSLSRLDINSNHLTGEISYQLGNLEQLTYLDLSRNDLVGMIPSEINILSALHTLNLSEQSLSGTLPILRFVPAMSSLDLSNNALVGTIPEAFLENTDPDPPITVNLASNEISGTVPISLGERFPRLNIDLTDNLITGLPFELCENIEWMNRAVDLFGCDAILCPPSTYSAIGRQDFKNRCTSCDSAIYFGTTSCGVTSSPMPLSFSSSPSPTPLSSNNPAFYLLSEQEALETLFRYTGGFTTWNNTQGWGVDGTPICGWYGVVCGGQGEVIGLFLDNNGLTGMTPVELFHLRSLERLVLANNPVDFSSIGIEQAASLLSVDASNTSTKSVEGIGEAPVLRSVNLDRTLVDTNTIEELFKAPKLEVLNLGYNLLNGLSIFHFVYLTYLRHLSIPSSGLGGTIPVEIGDLSDLFLLDFSDNELTGTIPDQLNKLTQLRFVYLSSLNLRGKLPALDELPQLQVFDVSSNLLTGSVPDLLGVLDTTRLIELNVSSNFFTGTLPESLGRFQNLNIDATGNRINTIPDELCQKRSWNGGDVSLYFCDGIMCPPGTYNEDGRQTSRDAPCRPCVDETLTEFYGSKTCKADDDTPGGDDELPDDDSPGDDDEIPPNEGQGDDVFAPETCSDDLVCKNGGRCQEIGLASGSYFCNCTTAIAGGLPHAGESCEYIATSLCSSGVPPFSSFCTNGGGCIKLVQPGQLHSGCQCPPMFKGAFCQFPSGSGSEQGSGEQDGSKQRIDEKSGYDQSDAANGDDSFHWWQILLIVAVPMALLLGAVFGYLFFGRASQTVNDRATSGGNLERRDQVMEQAAQDPETEANATAAEKEPQATSDKSSPANVAEDQPHATDTKPAPAESDNTQIAVVEDSEDLNTETLASESAENEQQTGGERIDFQEEKTEIDSEFFAI